MGALTAAVVATGTIAKTDQPEIRGDGFVLRPWRDDDLDDLVAAFADPAIQRWHCRSLSAGEGREWIAGWAVQWADETAASWAIAVDDRAAGQIGLRRIELHEGAASVSYWTAPQFRGRGLAGRALTALTAWSFRLGLHRLQLEHSTANPASCQVALRAGFEAEGMRRSSGWHADGWHDMHLHARIDG